MGHKNAIDLGHPARRTERLFTVASANATLVLVRKIVADIVEVYARLMRLRDEQQELALSADNHERLDRVRAEMQTRVDRLRQLHQEITDIGCEMKDLVGGLVDFPARYEGRRIWLCWRLGEAEVSHWHEVQAGFAGRQPIDDAFCRTLEREALARGEDGADDPAE